MKTEKRILIFSLAFKPFIGGAEIALEQIIKRLPQYEFYLLTARYARSLPVYEHHDNLHIYRVGFGHNKLDKYFFFVLAYFKAVDLQVKYKFQKIWGMMANYAGLAALLFKFSYDVRYLLTLQSGDSDFFIWQRTWFWYPLYRLIYTKADRIQAISSWLEKRARKYGYEGITEIIPNGVDLTLFNSTLGKKEVLEVRKEMGFSQDDKIIISVSRLVRKNGLEYLIKSLKYLPDKYKLILVGAGDLEQELINLSLNLNIKKRIKFFGKINHEAVPKYLQSSDVFCRPSLTEGFGNVFIEAMAAGLPVIATNVGGIKDFLHNNENGLVCEVKSGKSIAEKILELENTLLKNKLIENGKKLVEGKYSWDKIATQMQSVIRNL